jgi:protein-disulfide isomerase
VTTRTQDKKKVQPVAQNQQRTIIIGVIAAALLALVALIWLSGRATGSSLDFANLQPSRTADGGFVLGDPDAPVTIIEFADFACPACHQYQATAHDFIKEMVATGQARFEYRVVATAGGPATTFAGQIAECMDEQQPGAFWTAYTRFTDLARAGQYADAPQIVARELNMSYSDLLTCSENAEQVAEDAALAQQVGVSGTPAVAVRYGDGPATFISQQYNRGGVPLEVLRSVVQAANAAS